MSLITSLGEFLSVYILMLILVSIHSLFFFLGNPNLLGRIASWSLGVCPVFALGIHVPMGKEF